ncbi:MAG: hypothetical protein QOE01_2751 [Actinomycetota bacterium]|jgi:pimeloyl-ACP methyl ester carboxylesterase|nr:hypothetical protein [Actinomycetota bacterium]
MTSSAPSGVAAASEPIPPWPGELVEVGAGELFVRRAPAGDGAEPAVFVHGLGGSATNWTDLMALLRDRLEGAALDLPGFGWSPPPPAGDYSLEAHARAVVSLVERTGRGRVHLVGNSLGGTVSTLVAATRPDLVRTLTLVSPALPVMRPRASNAHLPALAVPWVGARLMSRLDRYPVEQRVRGTISLCFADPSRVRPERYAEAITEAARRARLGHEGEAMLRSLRALLSAYFRRGPASLWQVAARVTAPTLLVYGLRDRLVDPRTAARAARTFAGSRLLLLPDSGHVSQMEHPTLVAEAVRRLVDELG